ncbi:NAD-binding protein [Nocardia sp. NPDC051750]|uniref:NAD-binding protein n=1 Tax=Nocardia sp. NPDC051750 TaxID=3364325 RepID=UPI0037934E75
MPSIIGACVGDDVLAVDLDANGPFVLTRAPGGVTRTPWRPIHSRLGSLRNALASQARPHDTTSTILLAGLAGLLLALGTDWLIAMTALHHSPGQALYAAARIVATVGPADADADAPAWYLAFATATMLLTIGTTALFTAGVVNRLRPPRSVSLIGRRTLPTRDHVVVVGLGQVGLRLCTNLRRLRIPVVAVERNPRATNLRLAREANVPVLIAHADDRNILRTLSLHRARALAAMGADELDNVAVAITALSVAPDLRIVLRAGENEVIAETRSLFHIGEVRDVTALTTAAVTLSITGQPWQTVYASDHDLLAYPALDSACAALVRCECDGTPVSK